MAWRDHPHDAAWKSSADPTTKLSGKEGTFKGKMWPTKGGGGDSRTPSPEIVERDECVRYRVIGGESMGSSSQGLTPSPEGTMGGHHPHDRLSQSMPSAIHCETNGSRSGSGGTVASSGSGSSGPSQIKTQITIRGQRLVVGVNEGQHRHAEVLEGQYTNAELLERVAKLENAASELLQKSTASDAEREAGLRELQEIRQILLDQKTSKVTHVNNYQQHPVRVQPVVQPPPHPVGLETELTVVNALRNCLKKGDHIPQHQAPNHHPHSHSMRDQQPEPTNQIQTLNAVARERDEALALVTRLQQKMQHLTVELRGLINERSGLKEELNVTGKKCCAYADRIASLEDRVKTIDGENAGLRNHVKMILEESERSTHQNAEFRRLREKAENLELALNSNDFGREADLMKREHRLETESLKLAFRSKIEELEAENGRLRKNLAEAQARPGPEEGLEQARKELEARLKQTIYEYNLKVEVLERDMHEVMLQNTELRVASASSLTAVPERDALRADVERMNNEIGLLRGKLVLHDQLQKEAEHLRESAAKTAELQEMLEKQKGLAADRERLAGEVEAANNTITKLNTKICELTLVAGEAEGLHHEVDRLRECEANEAHYKRKAAEADSLKEQVGLLTSHLDSLRSEAAEVPHLTLENQNLKSQISRLTKALNASNDLVNEQSEGLRAAKHTEAALQTAREQLKEKTALVESLQENVKSGAGLKAQVEFLQAEAYQAAAEQAKLRRALEEALRKADDLRKEKENCQELKDEVRSLTKALKEEQCKARQQPPPPPPPPEEGCQRCQGLLALLDERAGQLEELKAKQSQTRAPPPQPQHQSQPPQWVDWARNTTDRPLPYTLEPSPPPETLSSRHNETSSEQDHNESQQSAGSTQEGGACFYTMMKQQQQQHQQQPKQDTVTYRTQLTRGREVSQPEYMTSGGLRRKRSNHTQHRYVYVG
eukprot:TRINITY_DN11568_c0_g1_i1.p1 TRINITY_DN11568_c0_g1~~TRINITY_DN11568_c0_g1_i1.p1  ORF type:complete len:951 (+),score=106.37 TRINITY_DN11568_c0_g1_i1:55-2907(+)